MLLVKPKHCDEINCKSYGMTENSFLVQGTRRIVFFAKCFTAVSWLADWPPNLLKWMSECVCQLHQEMQTQLWKKNMKTNKSTTTPIGCHFWCQWVWMFLMWQIDQETNHCICHLCCNDAIGQNFKCQFFLCPWLALTTCGTGWNWSHQCAGWCNYFHLLALICTYLHLFALICTVLKCIAVHCNAVKPLHWNDVQLAIEAWEKNARATLSKAKEEGGVGPTLYRVLCSAAVNFGTQPIFVGGNESVLFAPVG